MSKVNYTNLTKNRVQLHKKKRVMGDFTQVERNSKISTKKIDENEELLLTNTKHEFIIDLTKD